MFDQQNKDFWLPLDNAAKIYPAILTSEITAVFRISAVLRENIRIRTLYEAIDELENRFPYYKVRLKKGFFWYYLEHTKLRFPIEIDDGLPSRGFRSNKRGLLLRIRVLRNTISVEFSHILTDGTGGLAFLNSILLTYFKKCGKPIPNDIKYHKPSEEVNEHEFEDAYQRIFKKNLPFVPTYQKAFHLPFKLNKKPRLKTMIVLLSLKDIHKQAKANNTSITVYLVSIYLQVLQDIFRDMEKRDQRKVNKILRIQVPVNLRTMYPSETMRNFSLFVMPEIDLRLGEYTFDEILTKVYYLMKLETDKKFINKIIARNVSSEKRLEIRSTPLFIKSLIFNFMYKSLGADLYSGVITNLGKVSFSPEINELVEYFIFAPPPPNKNLKVNCGVVGFEDNLVLSFGNVSQSKLLETKFIEFLKSQGIDAKVL